MLADVTRHLADNLRCKSVDRDIDREFVGLFELIGKPARSVGLIDLIDQIDITNTDTLTNPV